MTQQKREFPPFDAQGQLFSLRTIRFWRSSNLRGWFCPGILTETLLALIAKWCSSPLECPFRLEETVMRKAILSVGLLLAVAGWARAAVVRVDAKEEPAGPYTKITGKVYFAVDARLAANRIITDIDYGPRNEKGLVEFSADLYMLKPARHNGTIFFEVSNRGRKGMLSTFNLREAGASSDPRTAAEFGDNFLLEQGFTLLWLGWQCDVPPDPPGPKRFYDPALN